jgi:hypothetical protein
LTPNLFSERLRKDQDGDDWEDLYEALGDDVELFVMLVAYLDDSASQNPHDTVSVAGWVIRARHVKPFSRRWSRLHHGLPFHLTDFDARRPPYKEMTNDERAELRQSQNDLISKYAVAIVGQGIDLGGLTPHAALLK